MAIQYRFADCRWSLDDPEWGRTQYLAGHIPGAVFLDVERDLAAPAGPGGRHPLPAANDFARAAGAAGIGAGVLVVAYGTLGGAERLWWLLRHLGHDDCAVMDFAGWHGPLTAGDEAIEPQRFTPRQRDDDTIEADELAQRLGELVAYCGSGVTSCVVLHRLALAGRDAKLYPGSWSEWEQLGLPVTRG